MASEKDELVGEPAQEPSMMVGVVVGVVVGVGVGVGVGVDSSSFEYNAIITIILLQTIKENTPKTISMILKSIYYYI